MFAHSRLACLLLIVPYCAIAPTDSLAQIDAENIPAQNRGGSYNRSDAEWESVSRYTDIREYQPRPADEIVQTIAVEWHPPERDALGNYLFIRGRLTIPGDDGASRPIDWFQGFTLLMAKSPDARPDWSRGIPSIDTESELTIARPSGEFVACVDLRDMERDREHERQYQFGLALGAHSSPEIGTEEIRRNWRDRPIPDSVQMLSVPAAPELAHELDLINQASQWQGQDGRTEHLIHAVNALHALGKEQALARMREYIVMTQTPPIEWWYFDERPVVAWIATLLFEPIEHETLLPPLFGGGYAEDDSAYYENWPQFPWAVVHDVPFQIQFFDELGEQGYEIPLHLDWVERHCVLREEPLQPSVNPLVAAEIILSSPQVSALEGFDREQVESALRDQAMSMVEGLLPPIEFPRGSFGGWDTEAQIQWHDRVEQSIELGITWDEERQEFVIPAKE
jgi:hypothetical protein